MKSLLKQIKTFIEDEFNQKLPKNRTFHSINHTKNVVRAVQCICQETKIDAVNKLCLEIAAWFHDYGHISVYWGHEDISAQMAEEFLLKHDFPVQQISLVKQYIQSTKIDLEPSCTEEEIIRDADLIHIGQDSYQQQLADLRLEWGRELGKIFNKKEWIEQNILFLESHAFHTDYAKAKYNNQREKNIQLLKEALRML